MTAQRIFQGFILERDIFIDYLSMQIVNKHEMLLLPKQDLLRKDNFSVIFPMKSV